MSPIDPLLRRRIPPALAAPVDIVLVLVFAAVGRSSHAESGAVLGVLATAAPFLLGVAAGWGGVRWRSGAWPARVGHGVTVWLAAVVVGMLVRAVAGAGVAASFVVVATLVLGVLLVGWRVLVGLGRGRGVPAR